MTASRSALIERIENAFQNLTVKSHCTTIIKSKIQAGTVNRVFDDFPELMSTAQRDALSEKFQDIITRISVTGEEVFLNSETKEAICAWEKEITRMGYQDLLDKHTQHIQPEVVKLLEWEPYLSQIKIIDIMCAYLGRINASVIQHSSEFIQCNHAAVGATVMYINAHYRQWIIEQLKKCGISLNIKDGSAPRPLIDNLEFKAAIAVTTAAVGLLGFGALMYALFKKPDEPANTPIHNKDEKSLSPKQKKG
jgi:hypothetical protein